MPAGSALARTDVPPANLWPIYSPDGRTLWRAVLKPSAPYVLDEIPAAGGPPLRSVEWPEACHYELPWKLAPSGNALTCIGEANGVYNLWNQPLSGGEAQPITRFKSGHVLDFDWSADGKRLFLWRGDATTEVVLITGFR